VVKEVPSALTLTFNEPITPLFIRLVGPDGKAIPVGDVVAENATVRIPAPPLERGSYVLSWRVISADGHPVGGSVVFSVGAPGRSSASETEQSGGTGVIAALWILRFTVYMGLFVGIGGAVFAAWVADDRAGALAAVRAVALATLAAGAFAALGGIGVQGMDALGLPLSAWREAATWQTGLRTSYGLTAVAAACALLAAGLSLLPSSRRRARVLSVAALLGAALALTLSGHAGTASPEAVSRPALVLHVACAIFWIGSLLPLLAMLRPGKEGASSLGRFSRAIPMPVAIVLASGSALALVQIDRIDALWETRYGQVLLCKLALVCVLLALAGLNRYRLVPKLACYGAAAVSPLRRSIAVELLLAFAILAAVTLWRFTPPPRALAVAAPISIHLHGERAMADIEIARASGPGAGARASVLVLDGDFQPLSAKEVTLVLASPGSGIESIRRRGAAMGESTWRIDNLTIPVAGQWNVRMEVLVNDFEKVMLEETVRLPRVP
jgi:copper transport protein